MILNYKLYCSVHICASTANGDSCQGDSGGPLIVLENGRYVFYIFIDCCLVWIQFIYRYTQIGVVSFGNECANPDFPGVYARLTEVLNWIRDVAKSTDYIGVKPMHSNCENWFLSGNLHIIQLYDATKMACFRWDDRKKATSIKNIGDMGSNF